MARIGLFFLLLAIFSYKANGQPLDSTTAKKMVDNGVEQVVKALGKISPTQQDTSLNKTFTYPLIPLNNPMVNLLTLLPAIFYVITLLVIRSKLTKEGAKLSWFLVDKELIAQLGKQAAQVETARFQAIAKAPVANMAALAAGTANPAFQAQAGDDNMPPPPEEGKESVSRLIALLTGLVTLGVASCVTSFYIYKSFTGHPDIDLGKLATVLYGLGLGLIPYGFTKVSGALKSTT